MGRDKAEIATSVYSEGKVISTSRTSYSHILKAPDMAERLYELMQSQHALAIASLKKAEKKKTSSDYLEEVRELLRQKRKMVALHMLEEALASYPGNPFLMSYYGCLLAIVEKNYKEGISICKEAIKRLPGAVPFGEEFFYPTFYLNLGRACLAAGKKKDAVEAFDEGLRLDPKNRDLLWEMKKLGTRKKPPIPFLPRDSSLNKYIGLLLAKVKH